MKRLICITLCAFLLAGLPCGAAAAELTVEAKSACLMDVATGTVLYESNSHQPLAPASVTKVMTLLLIMEAIGDGRIGWNDEVTASETAAAKGGSQIYLKAGEIMPVTDLVKSIAVSSANDAACAMAEHIAGSESAFVERMNSRAAELGMADTHFVNCTGLDDGADAASHRTSAYDIALMSRELLKNHPEIKKFTTIWMDTVRDGTFGLSNTNKLVRFYPGATGLKTGFTAGAGYCLSATAQREGMELIAVVMGCETSAGRNAACRQMLDYGFANFALVEPEEHAEYSTRVTLGRSPRVSGQLAAGQGLLIDKAQKNTVTMEAELEPSLPAPVSQGQRIGTLTVRSGEQILARIPILATERVPRLTWLELMEKILRRVAMAG